MRRLIPALLAVLVLAAFAYERTPVRAWDYDGVLDAVAPWLAVKPCCVKRQALTVNGQRIYTAASIDSVRVTGSTVRAYPRTRIDSVVGPTAVRWLDSTRWADSTRYHDTTVTRWLDSTRWADSVRWHDSVRVTPEIGTRGIPFGPLQLDANATMAPYTLSSSASFASTVVTRIADARTRGRKLLLVLTGGPHSNYMSTIDGVYQFDRAKWDAKLATFNTATIRQAVAQGVADGTIVGANVQDEPYVVGAGDGNTWGPKGTMTKARVDSLCGAVKALFPTLPAGVAHQHHIFEPTKGYRVCDFIIDQYGSLFGDVTAWRDAGLAMAARDHHAILFSLNVLDGGVQDRDGVYSCDGPGQAGKGTYAPNCRMTAADIVRLGRVLGPAGCALFAWRFDAGFFGVPANVAAFGEVASVLAQQPATRCVRTGAA